MEGCENVPNNVLTTDTNFPQLRAGQSNEAKFQMIMDYLVMLREQMQYSMYNLGSANFNETELGLIGKTITEPLLVKLEDGENNIAAIKLTAEALTAKMENAEGDIGLLWMAADELGTAFADTEENVSRLSQKVDSFTLSVENGETSSFIKLMAGSTEISSKEIKLNGLVTIESLENAGATTIDGGNIVTGTIKGVAFVSENEQYGSVKIDNGMIEMLHDEGYTCGAISMGDGFALTIASRSGTDVVVTSDGNMSLTARGRMKLAADGDVSMDAGGTLFLGTATDMGKDVQIGSSGRDVRIFGNLYINGQLYS